MTKVEGSTKIKTFINEILSLILNWKVNEFLGLVYVFLIFILIILGRFQYIVPFLLNQLGSVLYVYTLQLAALSFVVPVTNSLTFIFTVISGWLLGEDRPNFGINRLVFVKFMLIWIIMYVFLIFQILFLVWF